MKTGLPVDPRLCRSQPEAVQQRNYLQHMHFKNNMSARFGSVALGLILALGFLAEAKAEDAKAAKAADAKADPSGTWSWTVRGRQGADRKVTAKFKVSADKLTGTVSAPGRNGQTSDTDISEGKVSGEDVSFSTVREVNGNKITTKYTGKISGDTIKGKMEFERNGEPVSRDWEAKRETESK
jgi:hypothetical protein